MGELKKWLKQDWVRIGTDGKIKGKCGTSKDKKNPDRCLPRSKAQKREMKKQKLIYLRNFRVFIIRCLVLTLKMKIQQ